MKIEDCEIGMKVEPKHDIGIIGVSKGEKLVIKKVGEDTNGGCEGYLYFDGKVYVGVSAECFEPVNEFKIGDEVRLIHKLYSKGKIVYIFEEKDIGRGRYAVTYKDDEGRRWNFIMKEDEIAPLKKKDELEVGDKFKVKTAEGVSKRINEVLGVFEDEYYNQTKYIAKRMNGTYEGFVDIYNSEMIEEIIYD